MADINMEKVICQRDELSLVEQLKLEGINKVFILHDLYSMDLKNKIKERVKEKILENKEQNEIEENK